MKILYYFCFASLILAAFSNEIFLQEFNQTVWTPTCQFYARSGDQARIQIQYTALLSNSLGFYIYEIQAASNFDNMIKVYQEIIPMQRNIRHTIQVTLNKTSFYIFLIDPYIRPLEYVNQFKVVIFLNGDQILRKPLVIVPKNGLSKYVYYFQILNETCKAKISWNGPLKQIKVFTPLSQKYTFENSPIYTFPVNSSDYTFDITMKGRWVIVIEYQFSDSSIYQQTILRIFTFSDNRCITPCSSFSYPVIGSLFTRVGQQCRCDQKNSLYVWNKTQKKCFICKSGICEADPVCGNNKVQFGQNCDNGGNLGCRTGCVPDLGFNCTEANGSSMCASSCGDNIKASDEQCDNGGNPGCKLNCIPDPGFYCMGQVGTSSICLTLSSEKFFKIVFFAIFLLFSLIT